MDNLEEETDLTGEKTEQKVFKLLEDRLISELKNGFYFKSDFPKGDIMDLARPDLIFFKQLDENHVGIYPYEIKRTVTSMKPKQISPLSVELLYERDSFRKRLMNNLEEHKMQNLEKCFEEGKILAERLNPHLLITGTNLAYTTEMSYKETKQLEFKISEFIKRYDMYTVDTFRLNIDSDYDKKHKIDFHSRVMAINPMKNGKKIIYSASAEHGKRLTSYQVIINYKNCKKLVKVCPYILIPSWI